MVPVAIEVGLLLLDHTNLRIKVVLLSVLALLPDDDSSVSGATQKKVCDWMPLESANHREKLLEDLDLGPL